MKHEFKKGKRIKWPVFLFITLIGFPYLSCTDQKHQYDDEFYNSNLDFDVKRLPLLKPYFALSSPGDQKNWYVKLYRNNIKFAQSAKGDSLFAAENMIAIKCGNCTFDGQEAANVFYLLAPRDSSEFAFTNATDLAKMSDSLFHIKSIKFYSYNDIYDNYFRSGRLPWLK